MEGESTPVVPANRLLEVAGVLSDGAARIHEQLQALPPAERRALLDVVVGQVGDIVQAWSELVRAVVLVGADDDERAGAERTEPAPAPLSPQDAPSPADAGGTSPAPTERTGRGRLASVPDLAGEPAPGGGSTAVEPTETADTLNHDELTGVLNRQAGWASMNRELERSRANALRFVLGYLNVDGLGQVNDTKGPRAGDELLRKVAAALRATLRSHDVVLRLAGDEFLFALPGADLTTAENRLGEFRVILGEESPGATVSVGFAELRQGESFDELVARADEALVEARRRRGRRRLH